MFRNRASGLGSLCARSSVDPRWRGARHARALVAFLTSYRARGLFVCAHRIVSGPARGARTFPGARKGFATMFPSTGCTTLTEAHGQQRDEDLNEQFCRHLGLVMKIIRQRKMSVDEVQNSLSWAWYLFTRGGLRGETPRERCAQAAIFATRRRNDTFTSRNWRAVRRDAMTKLANVDDQVLSQLPERTTAAEVPGFEIEQMPAQLQEVAVALSQGLTLRELIDRGISRRVLDRAKHEIEDWIIGGGWYVPRYAFT
jgi:hypothetical protein